MDAVGQPTDFTSIIICKGSLEHIKAFHIVNFTYLSNFCVILSLN